MCFKSRFSEQILLDSVVLETYFPIETHFHELVRFCSVRLVTISEQQKKRKEKREVKKNCFKSSLNRQFFFPSSVDSISRISGSAFFVGYILAYLYLISIYCLSLFQFLSSFVPKSLNPFVFKVWRLAQTRDNNCCLFPKDTTVSIIDNTSCQLFCYRDFQSICLTCGQLELYIYLRCGYSF